MEPTNAQRSDAFYQLISDDSVTKEASMQKAASAVQAYTRTQVLEDGFLRKILPPIRITNADLDRSALHDRNVVVVDMENEQGNAISVPYGKLAAMEYINAKRYEVPISRTQTKKFYKDISTFRTDRSDVRQILANNLTKILLAEEDSKFIGVVNYCVNDAGGADSSMTPGNQYWEIDDTTAGYPSREGFNDALNILNCVDNPMVCSTILVNASMVNQLQKWGLDEFGSNVAGEIVIKGWSERNLLGRRLVVTIKRNLVKDNEMYMFAEPKFMGKFFTIEDTTVHMEREDGTIIKFHARKEDGCAIGNTKSVAKATFKLA